MKTKCFLITILLTLICGVSFGQSITSSNMKKGDYEFTCGTNLLTYTVSNLSSDYKVTKWVQLLQYKYSDKEIELVTYHKDSSKYTTTSQTLLWADVKAKKGIMPTGIVRVYYTGSNGQGNEAYFASKYQTVFISLGGVAYKNSSDTTITTIKLDYFEPYTTLKAPTIKIQNMSDPASTNMKVLRYLWKLSGFEVNEGGLINRDSTLTVKNPDMFAGSATVKAYPQFCDDSTHLASNNHTFVIERKPIFLNASRGGSPVTAMVPGDRAPITLSTNNLTNATGYEWTLPSGWATDGGLSGTFTTTSNTISVIPSGCGGATIKVLAKKGSVTTPSGQLSIGTSIAIQGPADVEPEATFTISNPCGTAITWSVSPNIVILASSNSSVTVYTNTAEQFSNGWVKATMSDGSGEAKKDVTVYGICPSFPVSAKRYEKVTIAWDKLPAGATVVETYFETNAGNHSPEFGTATSYSFIPNCPDLLSVRTYVMLLINSKYFVYQTTVNIAIEDDGVRPVIDGPATLAVGATGTYYLARNGQSLDGAIFADGWGTSWSYSPNLELVSSTPTTITVRNKATDTGTAEVKLAVGSPCEVNPNPTTVYYARDFEVQGPRNYQFDINVSLNAYQVPEGYVYVCTLSPYIYYPDIQHEWSFSSTYNEPGLIKVLTIDSPEFYDSNTSTELASLIDYTFSGDYSYMILVSNWSSSRTLYVNHRLITPTGIVTKGVALAIPETYGYHSTYNTVYPNPASSSVSIQASPGKQSTPQVQTGGKMLKAQAATPSSFELYNQQTGRQVKQGTYSGEYHSVDVSSLKNGIYLLKITNNGQSETHRIIVKH